MTHHPGWADVCGTVADLYQIQDYAARPRFAIFERAEQPGKPIALRAWDSTDPDAVNTFCFASRINPAEASAPRYATAFLEEKHLDTLCQFGIGEAIEKEIGRDPPDAERKLRQHRRYGRSGRTISLYHVNPMSVAGTEPFIRTARADIAVVVDLKMLYLVNGLVVLVKLVPESPPVFLTSGVCSTQAYMGLDRDGRPCYSPVRGGNPTPVHRRGVAYPRRDPTI